MAQLSRRDFLIRGGTGAAALGALAVLPPIGQRLSQHHGSTAIAHNDPASTVKPADDSSKHVVAYISDPKSGEIHYMVGTREIVHKDPGLVARMLRDAD